MFDTVMTSFNTCITGYAYMLKWIENRQQIATDKLQCVTGERSTSTGHTLYV